MARIIRNNEVYQEVSLSLFREREAQAAMASRAKLLFPGYFYSRFTAEVYSEDQGARIPDFVLIEEGYRKWYVGEVELSHHDLFNHVLPQVRAFRYGEYSERHVRSVVGHSPNFDLERLSLLFANTPPGVIVVVNKLKNNWRDAIHSEGALLSLFEIFRLEDSSDLIFRINGDHIEACDAHLSKCLVDESFQQALRVLTPAAIPQQDGDIVPILYNGVACQWLFRIVGTKGWFIPITPSEFPIERRFDLDLGQGNQLHLKPQHYAPQRRT